MTDPRSGSTRCIAFSSRSEEDTIAFGSAIGGALRCGDAVLVTGELGAGKTRLVQGLAEGVDSAEPARSPTFVLILQYEGRITLFHCDLYRIGSDMEADDLGLEECLEKGALAVEWPERAPAAMPPDALRVAVQSGATAEDRLIEVDATGPRSERLLAQVEAAASVIAASSAGPGDPR